MKRNFLLSIYTIMLLDISLAHAQNQEQQTQKKYIQESTLINNTQISIILKVRYFEQCFDSQKNLWGQRGSRKEYPIEPGHKQTFKFEPMGSRLTDKDCTQDITLKIEDAYHNTLLSGFKLTKQDTYELIYIPDKGYIIKAKE